MLKYSPSVFANVLVPVLVDVAEVDVLEAVELVVLLDAVELVEAAIVTTAVSRAEEDDEAERIEEHAAAARPFPQLFFSCLCSPEPSPKAPGPARNSRGCKETTDEVLDVAVVFTLEDVVVFTLEDVVVELLAAEAVPGTHW